MGFFSRSKASDANIANFVNLRKTGLCPLAGPRKGNRDVHFHRGTNIFVYKQISEKMVKLIGWRPYLRGCRLCNLENTGSCTEDEKLLTLSRNMRSSIASLNEAAVWSLVPKRWYSCEQDSADVVSTQLAAKTTGSVQ